LCPGPIEGVVWIPSFEQHRLPVAERNGRYIVRNHHHPHSVKAPATEALNRRLVSQLVGALGLDWNWSSPHLRLKSEYLRNINTAGCGRDSMMGTSFQVHTARLVGGEPEMSLPSSVLEHLNQAERTRKRKKGYEIGLQGCLLWVIVRPSCDYS